MDDDEDRATDHGEERHKQGSDADRQAHQSPPRFFAGGQRARLSPAAE
jgi:hypothetical protein